MALLYRITHISFCVDSDFIRVLKGSYTLSYCKPKNARYHLLSTSWQGSVYGVWEIESRSHSRFWMKATKQFSNQIEIICNRLRTHSNCCSMAGWLNFFPEELLNVLSWELALTSCILSCPLRSKRFWSNKSYRFMARKQCESSCDIVAAVAATHSNILASRRHTADKTTHFSTGDPPRGVSNGFFHHTQYLADQQVSVRSFAIQETVLKFLPHYKKDSCGHDRD